MESEWEIDNGFEDQLRPWLMVNRYSRDLPGLTTKSAFTHYAEKTSKPLKCIKEYTIIVNIYVDTSSSMAILFKVNLTYFTER